MSERIDERTAGRLERVPARARRFLVGSAAARGAPESAAVESFGVRTGPPDDRDEAAIAARLRKMRPADDAAAALTGRDFQAETRGIAAALVAKAREVTEALERGAPTGFFDAGDLVALESVLQTRGRPALRVLASRLEDLNAYPGADIWRSFHNDHERTLATIAAATGAVRVNDRFAPDQVWVQGSAWLVKPNLAVTNRHVLFPPLGGLRLARRVPGAMTCARLKTDIDLAVDFAFDSGPARHVHYRVTDVPFVSAESDPVDVALLSLERAGDTAIPPPAPLKLATEEFDQDYLYVVGHPGKLVDIPDEVFAVFGAPDERKRVSFGELMDGDESAPQDLVHDSSTIGGYSGGCVLGFADHRVAALHYLGSVLEGNRAIKATTLKTHAVGTWL
jgi:hypothetical protein